MYSCILLKFENTLRLTPLGAPPLGEGTRRGTSRTTWATWALHKEAPHQVGKISSKRASKEDGILHVMFFLSSQMKEKLY
jgi:hypothetical protein